MPLGAIMLISTNTVQYTQEVAKEKQKLFATAAALLIENGVDPFAPASALWVPGRIEVVGKHTDYAGGRYSEACYARHSYACLFLKEGLRSRQHFTTFAQEPTRCCEQRLLRGDSRPD
jgi:hypothetical protein